MFNIGPLELFIILLVALLIFGSKLPQVARQVGKSITEFKRNVQQAGDEVRRELERSVEEPPAAAPSGTALSDAIPTTGAAEEAAAAEEKPGPGEREVTEAPEEGAPALPGRFCAPAPRAGAPQAGTAEQAPPAAEASALGEGPGSAGI